MAAVPEIGIGPLPRGALPLYDFKQGVTYGGIPPLYDCFVDGIRINTYENILLTNKSHFGYGRPPGTEPRH